MPSERIPNNTVYNEVELDEAYLLLKKELDAYESAGHSSDSYVKILRGLYEEGLGEAVQEYADILNKDAQRAIMKVAGIYTDGE